MLFIFASKHHTFFNSEWLCCLVAAKQLNTLHSLATLSLTLLCRWQHLPCFVGIYLVLCPGWIMASKQADKELQKSSGEEKHLSGVWWVGVTELILSVFWAYSKLQSTPTPPPRPVTSNKNA